MLRLLVVVFVGVSAGCSHAVRFEVPGQPDAEVSVGGVEVGKAPTTYTEQIGTKGSSYEVKAELPSGEVLQEDVKRSETSMAAVGIGAGVGVGACCGIVGVSTLLVLVGVPFGGVVGCVGCVALPAGPLVGWLMGGQSPDTVVLQADTSRSRSSTPPPPAPTMSPPPPTLTPPASPGPSAPPPPTTY